MASSTVTVNGIVLSNKNLLQTDNLAVQLAMILEIVSDLSAKGSRAAEAINDLLEKQRATTAEVKTAMKSIEKMDGVLQQMDTKFTKHIRQVEVGPPVLLLYLLWRQ